MGQSLPDNKSNLESVDSLYQKNMKEDLNLNSISLENYLSSNTQSMSENLQIISKDNKKVISKLNNEPDIQDEASKQNIKESTQIDTLHKDKDSYEVRKQTIEGTDKEGSEKKYETIKQSIVTGKEIDQTKNVGKELQKHIVSS